MTMPAQMRSIKPSVTRNATRKSTSEIDKAGAKHLREALNEAGAGLLGQIKPTSA